MFIQQSENNETSFPQKKKRERKRPRTNCPQTRQDTKLKSPVKENPFFLDRLPSSKGPNRSNWHFPSTEPVCRESSTTKYEIITDNRP
ncbi:hypothetical protein CEXT_358031 [Caerostris extrusa]|uniref:Uncharacterized protein n=1 Tax=Caerostris extrusa TaxID=172846 RepID=A0AAV4VDT7_CAEEX|nr:hypothetical protein CEXT_358031 [Caerostris extrusa]